MSRVVVHKSTLVVVVVVVVGMVVDMVVDMAEDMVVDMVVDMVEEEGKVELHMGVGQDTVVEHKQVEEERKLEH